MYRLLILLLLVTVVPAKSRTSKHLLFLVDKSGSMGPKKASDAMQQFLNYSAQPIDAAELCVYQFSKYPVKWSHGWRKLPSQFAIDDAKEFLLGQPNDSGYNLFTKLEPAIIKALSEPKEKLTIIIISDGQFDEGTLGLIDTIQKWQKWRVKNGHGKAMIGCIGIGSLRSGALKEIAQLKTGVGYYHLEKKKSQPLK